MSAHGHEFRRYLAARTAAFERRFRAAIFYDGVYDFSEFFRAALPKEASATLDAGDTSKGEEMIRKGMENSTNLRWTMTHGVWSFGASSIADFLTKTKQMTMAGIAGRIQCPASLWRRRVTCFSRTSRSQTYDALQAPKQFVRFNSEDGPENHCQSDALAYKDEVALDL